MYQNVEFSEVSWLGNYIYKSLKGILSFTSKFLNMRVWYVASIILNLGHIQNLVFLAEELKKKHYERR